MGNWGGTPNYRPEMSVYKFSVYNYHATLDEYSLWMKDIFQTIKTVGDTMAKQDLAENILIWSSWSYSPTYRSGGPTGVTSVALTSNPADILNTENTVGTITNVNSDCVLQQSYQSYNYATAIITTQFSYSSMMKDSTCAGILNPFVLGYDPSVDADIFAVSLDVNSFFTTLAIAYQVNGPNSYDSFVTVREITRSLYPLYPHSDMYNQQKMYVVVDRFDSNFPGMTPITCVGPEKGPTSSYNCFIRQGASYGIPYLQHKGRSLRKYEKCTCSGSETAEQAKLCDDFNFLLGTQVYDHASPIDYQDDGYTAWLNSVIDPDTGIATGGHPVEFVALLPLLELFVVPPVISTKIAAENAAAPAWTSMFGQLCEAERCAPRSIVKLTKYAVTSGKIVDLIKSDYLRVMVSMTVTITSGTVVETATVKKLSLNSDNTYTALLSKTSITTLCSPTSPTSQTCPTLTFTCTGRDGDFINPQNRTSNYYMSKVQHYGVMHSIDKATYQVSGTTTAGSTDLAYSTGTGKYCPLGDDICTNGVALTDTAFKTALTKACTTVDGTACSWYVSGPGIHPTTYSLTAWLEMSVQSVTDTTPLKVVFKNKVSSPQSTTDKFTFSTQAGAYGSFIVINSFNTHRKSITPNQYQLDNAACANSISFTNASAAIVKPWGDLIEVYYQCTAHFSDAVLNAAGIAAGTAGLIVPTIFFSIMILSIAISAMFWPPKDLDNDPRNPSQSTFKLSVRGEPDGDCESESSYEFGENDGDAESEDCNGTEADESNTVAQSQAETVYADECAPSSWFPLNSVMAQPKPPSSGAKPHRNSDRDRLRPV